MQRLIGRFAKGKTQGSDTFPAAGSVPRQTRLRPRRTLHALESRIVFDGGVVAAVAAIPEPQADPVPVAPPAAAGQEVVFVDSHVQDSSALLEGIASQAEVVYLDAGSDGVEQMADYLAGRHDIAAIHIVSHGDQGLLLLGDGPLFDGNLDAHSADLTVIGNALAPDGDILLYGCNVAEGESGRTFVEALAAVTGADVAASSGDTGAAARGGDWDLEITTGTITAVPVLEAAQLGSYDYLLHTASVSTAAQLQAAITAGNADGSADLITLTGNITLSGTQISINVTDGQTMTIVGGGFTLDAAYQSRAIDVQAGTVEINNLTITHGLLSGAGGAANRNGSNGGDALGAAIYNAGTLTITGSTLTGNVATGGGGGGGGDNGTYWGGYAGGGGSGFAGIGGGAGGTAIGSSGPMAGGLSGSGSGGGGGGGMSASGSAGGHQWGGGADLVGGNGGTSAGGGAGGMPSTLVNGPWRTGGNGGTASASGGGGGGSGYNGTGNGGNGGSAVGGIYNVGTLNIASTTFSSNLGSGGGGGGAGQDGGTSGLGGTGTGAIWNAGGILRYQSSSTSFSGNAGATGGSGGNTSASNPAVAGISNISGTVSTSTWLPPNFSGLDFSADTGSSSSDFITATAAQTITATLSESLDAGDVVWGSLDGGATWTDITSKVSGTMLTWNLVTLTGSGTLKLKAIDSFNNTSAVASQAYTLDQTAPAAPTGLDLAIASDSGSSATDNITSDTTPTINGGGAAAGAAVTLYDTDGTTVLGTTTADGAGNWSVTSSAVAAGSHTLTVKQTDVAGNTSLASAGLAITVDTSAPAAPGVTAISADSGSSGSDQITSDATLIVSGTAEANAIVTVYRGGVLLGTTTANGLGNWTYDYTGTTLAAGSYNFTATATDTAGNVSAASPGLGVTIDTTAAAPTGLDLAAASDSGSSSTDNLTSDATPSINGGGAESGAAVTLYDTDGTTVLGTATADGAGNWSITSSALAAGGHTLTVKQTDVAGNASLASAGLAVTIDTSAPAAPAVTAISTDSGSSGSDRITSDTTLLVSGTAEANATVTVYRGGVMIGTTAANGAGNWSFDYTGTTLAEGSYSFTATATDTAGNVSATSAGLGVTIDASAPGIPVITLISTDAGSSATDEITNDTTLGISGTAEANSTVAVYRGGVLLGTTTANGLGNWTYDYTGTTLAAGSYNFTATATDTAGNVSAASPGLGVMIDTTAAAPTGLDLAAASDSGSSSTDNLTSDATPSINGGGAEAGAAVTLYDTDGTTVLGTATADGAGNWSITSSALAAGGHTLTVKQTDVAGNTSLASAGLAITIDTSAPAAPAVTAISTDSGSSAADEITSDTTLLVSGTAEANATVTVYRGGVMIGTTAANGAGNWSFDYTGTTLAEGSYSFTATATDTAGNVSATSAGLGVTIDASAPGIPVITLISTDAGSSATDEITNDTTLGISGTAEANSTVAVYRGGVLLGTTTANGLGNWTYDYTGTTLAAGSYNFTATATDAAGNTSALSAVLVVTVDTTAAAPAGLDLAAASDSGLSSTDNFTAYDTPTINGGGAEAGATVTLYDTDGTTVLGTTTADGSGNWSMTSSTLSAGSHTLTARQTDVAGNVSAASAGLAITIDTSAPAAPVATAISTDSGSSAADEITSDTTLLVSGTAEANSTVTVYRGGVMIGTTAANGAGNWSFDYTGTTLAAGSYSFTATASDAAGNNSPLSAALLVTIDTTAAAPTGLDLAAASDSGSSSTDNITNDTTPTINGGGAEAGATVTLYDTDGTTVLDTATADGAGNWSLTSSALSAGSHTLTARQTDVAGNVSIASAGLTVTIDTSAAAPTGLDLASASDSGSSNTDNLTNDTTPTISGTAEAGATVTLYDTDGSTALGTATADGGGNWSITSSALAAGSHTLTARQTDVAGNTSAASGGLMVTVDASAAAPTGLDLAAASDSGSSSTDNLTSDATPTISGGGAEAGATIALYDTDGTTLLGTATADGSGNWSITSSTLVAGSHTLTSKQTDVAGNVSAASGGLTVTIDTSAAAPAGLDLATASDSGSSSIDNLTNVTTPTVSGGSAEAGAAVTLYDTDGTTILGTTTADGSGNWSITSSALGEGSHTLTARQTDVAGNVSAASAGLTITLDQTAPAITFSGLGLLADTGTSTTDFITATAAQTVTATLSTGLGLEDTVWGSLDNGATWSDLTLQVSGTTLTWTGVTLTGSNTLKLKVTDGAGNDGTVVNHAYVLDSIVVTPALALAVDTGSNPTDGMTSNGTVNVAGLEAGASWQYSLDGGATWNIGTGNSVALTGDGAKSVIVRQTDAAGNVSANSAPLVFTLDTSAPADGITAQPLVPPVYPSVVGSPPPPAATLPPPATPPVTEALAGLAPSASAPAILVDAFPIFSSSPMVIQGLGTFSIETGQAFVFSLPKDAFPAGVADSQLTYQASLANGRPLPNWLHFDPETGTFSGVMPEREKGTLQIRVKAVDSKDNASAYTFTIKREMAGQKNAEPPPAPRASAPSSGTELLSLFGIPGLPLEAGLAQPEAWAEQQAERSAMEDAESVLSTTQVGAHALRLSAQLEREAHRFAQAREATLRHLAALE